MILSLPQVYRALNQFDGFFYELQQYIHEKVESIVGRKLEYSFYDVTNYYTEKDFADPDETYRDRHGNLVTGPALAQKGVSKEHQPHPHHPDGTIYRWKWNSRLYGYLPRQHE